MSGEQLHELGREGARRAKEWLEATTRVNAHWVNPDRYAIPKLSFYWADSAARKFSFDLGGVLLGGDLHSQMFLAESKLYKADSDQGTLYVEYLAKCYRALAMSPERCDNFMWITWSPFSIKRWATLCTAPYVKEAITQHAERVFGDQKRDPEIEGKMCEDVARRLWLIVLSERQESLVISREHRAIIQAHEVRREGTL
ncbi:MAG: hypothetical protein LC775_13230 [Acidobacteria bacterium]|nr:hypothetical protein [Acidobacteriota bacterium]